MRKRDRHADRVAGVNERLSVRVVRDFSELPPGEIGVKVPTPENVRPSRSGTYAPPQVVHIGDVERLPCRGLIAYAARPALD